MAPPSPSSRSTRVTGLLATIVNFPVVLAGLVAITVGAEGNDKIALLNLWALWGVAQGLLGQVAQVSGVLDGREWTDRRALRLIPLTAVPATLVAFLLADTWFPDHRSWWIATLLLLVSVIIIGRQRAVLIRRFDGTHALVVAALENCIRSAAMIVLLVASAEGGGALGWGAVAIVGPFVVSMALLASRIEAGAPPGDGRPVTLGPAVRSIASGVLTGMPAVAAYAVIPGLTLLEVTDDLGAIAIAASLLRGPLLVATFAAPVLLERWVVADSAPVAFGLHLVPAGLVIVQLATSAAIGADSLAQLAAQTVLAGTIAGLTYVLVLRSLGTLSTTATAWWGTLAATVVFVAVLLISGATDLVHPFVALGASNAAIVLVLAATTRAGKTQLR